MREVDSVRRSLFVGTLSGRGAVVMADERGVDWLTSQGMGVKAAPPIKSSSSVMVVWGSSGVGVGVEVPLWSRPLERVFDDWEGIEGSGKRDKGLETETTRSRARR